MNANPLLVPSDLPYQLPRFADIRDEHFIPAFDAAIAEHTAEIAAIATNSEPATWENTVEALERSGQALGRVHAVFANLYGTDASEALDAVATDITPKLAAHSDSVYQNADLYARIQAVTPPPGDEESSRLHAYLLRAFRRRGADLSTDAKAELVSINQRLSVLSDEFSKNLLSETNALAVDLSEGELAGFDASRRQAAAAAATALGRTGYVVPLDLPTVQADQAVLERASARMALYEASQKRGTGSNVPVLLEMVRLRARRAEMLGYPSHADYVIEEETAGSADAARTLLRDLAPAAAANAAGEYKLIAELADTTAEEKVDGADWPYWESKLRERDYSLDAEELRRYFPLDRVLRDGVFYAAERLYGIRVEPRPDLAGYAPDVDVWEVKEADGTGIGLFLTDYYARPSKRGGAWMSGFVEQSRLLGLRPVIINVMGVTKPTDGSPALLTLDEVTTMFHEFGHALHGLLSDVRYPTFSGTNVPRDYVEFPSQINENWALDPAILRNYARHIDTGKPLPSELIDAITASRQFGQGFATSEYLAAAIIDMAWHSLSSEEAAGVSDVRAFEEAALQDAGLVVEHLKPRYQSTYFNHIFGGGYSAGYYSYLWAEALDADGFDWFTETGAAGPGASGEAARAAGQRFRDLVLSRGGASDYAAAFESLRGRAKDVAPLLRRRGLGGAL